nr:PAS domain S-box protein [uncultured Methanoregula sp.]
MFSALYVDDEPVLLEVGKMFLEMSGSLHVDTAISAAEALEKMRSTRYDCIISDYQMPGMDGIAFLKQIRNSGNTIPFILFTGKGREEVVIEAFANKADFYLQKGGDPASQFVELEHKIRLVIESRRTQAELLESQQRTEDIIDHLPDPTLAIDLQHRVIVWNKAMEELTGIPKEQILGTSDRSYALPFYQTKRPLLLDLILSPDPETEKEYPAIIKNGRKLISEIFLPRFRDGDGAYFWFIASPLYDTKGSITGAIESIRDVTERRKFLKELHESEERYRAVVEDQTEFISRFLPDGTHVFVNAAYCRYFGKKPEEIIGTRFHPELLQEDEIRIREHLASLTPEHPEAMLEHSIIMPDGKIRWQQWNDRAIFDDTGKLREYQSVGRDITERKAAEDSLLSAYEQITATEEELRAQFEELKQKEEDLTESQRILQGIVNGSPIPQFVLDKNHRVISWNHALEEVTGTKAADVLGTTRASKAFYGDQKRPVLADLLLEGDTDNLPNWYAGKYHKSKYVNDAYEVADFFPHMGTEGIWLLFTASTIRDTTGAVIAAVETLDDITDLKKSEEALTESEEKYRTILENIQDVYYRSDREGNLILASPSVRSVFGYDSVDEFYGKSIADSWYANPEDRTSFLKEIQKNGSVSNYEVTLKKRDGSPIRVSTNSHIYYDKAGQVAGVEGTIRDVTDLRHAEQALIHCNLQLTDIIENLPDATFAIDREGRVIAWNHAMEEMTGVPAAGIIGKGGYEYALPFYGNRRPLLIDQILKADTEAESAASSGPQKTSRALEASTIVPALKGKETTLRAIASPILNQQGELIGAIQSIVDISEIRETREKLKRNEEQYRTLFENTGSGTVLIDENTMITLVNAEFEHLSGYSRQEIEGKKKWTEFVVKEDLARMLEQHRTRRDTPGSGLKTYEFRFITKSGEIRHIHLIIDLIPGTKNSVASLTDITDTVRGQEALRLANRKLNLLSSITRHDVLNQLTSLLGFLALARQRVEDAEVGHFIERGTNAAKTIRSQIEFTRDYQDIGIHSPEWQNVHELIDKAQKTANIRGINVIAEIGDVEIYADLLMEKVFYNLIENAARHGGHVTEIRFSARRDADTLIIIVEDNGIGVPADAREGIFERRYFQNTGLGLFLSREILSITGLTIKENGTPGKGARFEILVPRAAFRTMDHPDPVES